MASKLIALISVLLLAGCSSRKPASPAAAGMVGIESLPLYMGIGSITNMAGTNRIPLYVTNTVEGQQYLLEFARKLEPGFWVPYEVFTGQASPTVLYKVFVPVVTARFYRVAEYNNQTLVSDSDTVTQPWEILPYFPPCTNCPVTNRPPVPPIKLKMKLRTK